MSKVAEAEIVDFATKKHNSALHDFSVSAQYIPQHNSHPHPNKSRFQQYQNNNCNLNTTSNLRPNPFPSDRAECIGNSAISIGEQQQQRPTAHHLTSANYTNYCYGRACAVRFFNL